MDKTKRISKNKLLGCFLMLLSMIMSANMLSVPMIFVQLGFFQTTFLFILAGFLLTVTGIFTLEVVVNFEPLSNNFGTIAQKTLGIFGNIFVSFCYVFFLYFVIGKHLYEVTALPKEEILGSKYLGLVAIVLFLGMAVFFGARVIDYGNRTLLFLKIFFLLALIILLMGVVNIDYVFLSQTGFASRENFSVWEAALLFASVFKFHLIIPSLCNYMGHEARKLKGAIIKSSIVASIFYLLFSFIVWFVLFRVGENGFTIYNLNQLLFSGNSSYWINVCINMFYTTAMLSFLLMMSLGLFDFFADSFGFANTRLGRLKTLLLAFVPILIIVIFYSKIFMAVIYANFCLVILTVIFPVWCFYRLKSGKVD